MMAGGVDVFSEGVGVCCAVPMHSVGVLLGAVGGDEVGDELGVLLLPQMLGIWMDSFLPRSASTIQNMANTIHSVLLASEFRASHSALLLANSRWFHNVSSHVTSW